MKIHIASPRSHWKKLESSIVEKPRVFISDEPLSRNYGKLISPITIYTSNTLGNIEGIPTFMI